MLGDSRALKDRRGGATTWVSGSTHISSDSTIEPDPRSANWKTDWSVQLDPRGAMQFTAELDPGLELLDVTGPEVKEYQSAHAGPSTRVNVLLSGRPGAPTAVHFEAHAKIPLEGGWSVPAIHPLDAVWTGGITSVELDCCT